MSSASSVTPYQSRLISHALSVTLLAATLLAGCAVAPLQPLSPAQQAKDQCGEVFRRVDGAVAESGVADGMGARVAGFPYLRVNRFLASYARGELSDPQYGEWMDRMIAIGAEARALELANLSAAAAARLASGLRAIDARFTRTESALAECAALLAAFDRADPGRRAELMGTARVPDEYLAWQRIVGLYWLTRVPFSHGVRSWHESVRAEFARPLAELAVAGKLNAYVPPRGRLVAGEVAALLERASVNALGIPEPRGQALEALYRTYAPEFVVDTVGAADHPGALGWAGGEAPEILGGGPFVYRRLSHTRYGGRPLLQLNYSIWFPERPKTAGWNILGGRLDGVLWRVTLAPDGTPWVYDSIHLCGCYHQFFPTARAAPKAREETFDEPALIPQVLPRVAPGARVMLRFEAGTHYLQRVVVGSGSPDPAIEYAFADDDTLRSMPLPQGGRRSAFRPDGIVPGSERGERFLFWPMGMPEPGAMRQWGRHATAFVGRRHFDDPGLLERYFILENK